MNVNQISETRKKILENLLELLKDPETSGYEVAFFIENNSSLYSDNYTKFFSNVYFFLDKGCYAYLYNQGINIGSNCIGNKFDKFSDDLPKDIEFFDKRLKYYEWKKSKNA